MRRGLHNSRVQGGGAMVAALPSRFWRARGGRQLRWSPRCWTTIDIQNIDKRRLGSKSNAFTFTQRCSLQQSPLLPTAPPAPGQLSAIGSDLRNQTVSRRGSGEALPPPASACALGIDGRENPLNYSSHHPQRAACGSRLTAPEMSAAGSLRGRRPGQTRGPEAAAR